MRMRWSTLLWKLERDDPDPDPGPMQIVVGSEEPQDIALKRFKREVMNTGLVQEVGMSRWKGGFWDSIRFYIQGACLEY